MARIIPQRGSGSEADKRSAALARLALALATLRTAAWPAASLPRLAPHMVRSRPELTCLPRHRTAEATVVP